MKRAIWLAPPACIGAILAVTAAAKAQDAVAGPGADDQRVLVTVDQRPVTEADLQLLLLVRQIEGDALAGSVRRKLVEQLVDERLIGAFLAQRRVVADRTQLDTRVAAFKNAFARAGGDLAARLSALGRSEEDLGSALGLPLAWQAHINRVITPAQVREFFAAHRVEYDGTQVRASHILIGMPPADAGPAEERLRQIRTQILDGNLSFADAAARFSESPSRSRGGDVGFFSYRGQMPAAFVAKVFPLSVGEISEPFRTPFGVHIATVTERLPGDLSLEDARPDVLRTMSGDLWQQTATQLRQQAKIEWQE
jgi:parvulin-like peptidyl-prolyl isomerase